MIQKNPFPNTDPLKLLNVVDWTLASEAPFGWHPRLTGYRLLVLLLIAGFGVSKAVLTYLDRVIVSVTFEWIFGAFVISVLYGLRFYEKSNPHSIPSWFFKTDYASYIWKLLALCCCPVPSYSTDERIIVGSIQICRPPLTGYRILVSAVVATFALTKAILAYWGVSGAATAIGWVLGGVATISLYWLGLYEYGPVGMFPALFETDYLPVVQRMLLTCFRNRLLRFVIRLLAHALAMCFIAGWIYLWAGLFPSTCSMPPDKPHTPFSTMAWWYICGMATTLFSILALSGIIAGFINVLALPLAIGEASTVGEYIARRLHPFINSIRGSIILRHFLPILGSCLLILAFIVCHVVGMLMCVGFGAMGLDLAMQLWIFALFRSDSGLYATVFMGFSALLYSLILMVDIVFVGLAFYLIVRSLVVVLIFGERKRS